MPATIFHDWFSKFRYNLDLVKLEWTLLLFNSTKSVIFQIDSNCSPFQLLNMLPFHIGLVSNFSRYFFKTGTPCVLFLSSHVFPGLQFDNNYFDIPLWKTVKPRDHTETKPPNGKLFRKYKVIKCFENNCLADF